MSSLIYCADETQVMLATDTLCTSDKGEPAFWTSKAFIVPHLNLVMAGTGVGGFAGRWFVEVNERMILRDIENLDYHTPGHLARLWDEFMEKTAGAEHQTTTVYCFGFAVSDGLMRIHAYRSSNNFKSERLNLTLAVKPACDIPQSPSFPQDFIPMMENQRAREALTSQEDRIHIGGEIQVVHLSQSGFNCFCLHRFDDFDAVSQRIFNI